MTAPDGSSVSEELQTMESLSRSLAGGRYRIMRLLGAGAMGSVRLAEDTALHRRVAIKTVKEEVARNPEIRKRIERECLLHAKVGPHPNIVTLFDKLEYDDEMHLVMEYIDGETLQARLERNSEMGIVMPPSESILIASQVLDALSRIHAQGIVHRDIKPANIMLTYTESGTVCAKLMDFGVSRFAEDNDQLSRLTTTSNGGPGTPLYMAPEQIDSKTFGEVSYATDVYAMGIMLYQLLSGKPPFRGTLTEVLNGHLNMPVPPIVVKLDGVLPETIEGLLKRALAKKTFERIQSAKAFREELIALTGVGDTMSRLNATVQLNSASSVNAQTVQSGLNPTATQTFFGGNTIMRLARYRRSMRVLGVGVALVLLAIVATAVVMMRGDGKTTETSVASTQPMGEIGGGALAPPAPVVQQPPAPTAGSTQTQTTTQPAVQPLDGTTAPQATTPDQAGVSPTMPIPGQLPVGDPNQPNASMTPGVAPVPGTTPADAQSTGAVPTAEAVPDGTVPPVTPQTDPTMLASNQPNAMTTTGTPVIVEGATVQTPDGAVAPTAGTGQEYVVVSGDTLSKIAKAHSITVEDLRWWNDILNPYSLKVGQNLKLYASPDIKPKEEFLAQAAAAEKARKEAAAAKAQESGTPAPEASAPSSGGGTLESQFKGTPVAPVTPPPAKKEEKPKRGLFRGMFQGR
ncbi:MAG: protein kinase [Candidatus Hydrogenedentes bacterium]|nr:protein kinase [Candidatus Hydrogenedentota bacterium]